MVGALPSTGYRVAGAISAIIDSVLSQSVDRAATFVKSSHKHEQTFIAYLKSSASYSAMLCKLVEGFSMYVPKQVAMQVTLFLAQSHAKAHAEKLFPVSETNQAKVKQAVFVTAVTPIFPALIAGPFDVMKTLLQHPGAKAIQPGVKAALHSSTEVVQQHAVKPSLYIIYRTLLDTHGSKGLFAGVGWKIVLTYTGYTINAAGLTLYDQAMQSAKEQAVQRKA